VNVGFPRMPRGGSGYSMNGIESYSHTTMDHVSQPLMRKDWFDWVIKGWETARPFCLMCDDRKVVRGFYCALCYASAITEHEVVRRAHASDLEGRQISRDSPRHRSISILRFLSHPLLLFRTHK
jgi:hypothetical protein